MLSSPRGREWRRKEKKAKKTVIKKNPWTWIRPIKQLKSRDRDRKQQNFMIFISWVKRISLSRRKQERKFVNFDEITSEKQEKEKCVRILDVTKVWDDFNLKKLMRILYWKGKNKL